MNLIEILKLFFVAGLIIAIMKGVAFLSAIASKKLGVNKDVLTKIVIIIVFITCTILWNFTDVYERFGEIIGIPVVK